MSTQLFSFIKIQQHHYIKDVQKYYRRIYAWSSRSVATKTWTWTLRPEISPERFLSKTSSLIKVQSTSSISIIDNERTAIYASFWTFNAPEISELSTIRCLVVRTIVRFPEHKKITKYSYRGSDYAVDADASSHLSVFHLHRRRLVNLLY